MLVTTLCLGDKFEILVIDFDRFDLKNPSTLNIWGQTSKSYHKNLDRVTNIKNYHQRKVI